MQAPRERWKQLCDQIAVEQDHEKFTQLVDELNKLLAGKEQQLNKQREPDTAAGKANP